MKKLHLNTENWHSSPFQIKKLNILFVFQVNCPGCFAYGIPFMNGLHNQFSNAIGILGVSTAFENYNLNTLKNTKQFVLDNTLVGHTKEVFEKEGYTEYPYKIEFPVTFDKIADENFDYQKAAFFIAEQNDGYLNADTVQKEGIVKNVTQFLKKQDAISETFTLNQFKGTPSFVIFDDNYNIKASFFGHQQRQEIVDFLLDSGIKQNEGSFLH